MRTWQNPIIGPPEMSFSGSVLNPPAASTSSCWFIPNGTLKLPGSCNRITTDCHNTFHRRLSFYHCLVNTYHCCHVVYNASCICRKHCRIDRTSCCCINKLTLTTLRIFCLQMPSLPYVVHLLSVLLIFRYNLVCYPLHQRFLLHYRTDGE